MKYNVLFLMTLLFSFFQSNAGIPSFAGPHNQGAVQQGGLMKMPTEAEMKEINDFLATLSEDELKELAKLGEEIIATAEKEGVPLFYPSEDVPATLPVPSPKPIEPALKKPDTQKPVKKLEKSESKATKKMLKNLVEIINSIKKKVASDALLADSFIPLNQQTNTFLYYLTLTMHDKISGYLADKEFEKLNKQLTTLEEQLEELNNNFDVPTKHTLKVAQYQKAMKSAEKALDQIIRVLQKIFFEQNITTELEKLIKKYDPEALKIKKELEIQERSAHEATKKIPITNNGRPATMPSRMMVDNAVQTPFTISNNSQSLPLQTVSKKNDKQKESKQEKPLKVVKSNEKKIQASQKLKPTLADLENRVKTQFDKVEASLIPHKKVLSDCFADNQTTIEEPKAFQELLQDANFELKKLKKVVTQWHDSVEKIAQNRDEYCIKVKPLQDFFQSERHKTVKLVHNHTKQLSNTRRAPLDGNLKQFKSFMDDIEKRLTGIQS